MEVAALRGGTDAEVVGGICQPQAHLRETPGRAIQDRGDRPDGDAATGEGRPDPGDPDAGAQAAGAGAQDHRRPLQHRARAGGAEPDLRPQVRRMTDLLLERSR